jgi:hypothetical protein
MEDLEAQEDVMEIEVNWEGLNKCLICFEKAYREHNGPNGWLLSRDTFVHMFSSVTVWSPQLLDLIIDKYPNYSISEYEVDGNGFIEFSFSGGER